ncbi:hypothetical protein [uncultured Psychrobacter sp.]|nr:hypothetical protein [uncultured Psychrobacter sp.]
MKSLFALLSTMMLLSGCQSFQFVESPIPVTSVPTTLYAQVHEVK